RASRKELDRVRRSLPNPSGCRKLGRLAPQHCTGPCFPPGASPYATPALFATGLRDAAEAPAPFADLLGPEAFSEPDPLDVIARILRRIEEKLTVLQPPSTDEEPS